MVVKYIYFSVPVRVVRIGGVGWASGLVVTDSKAGSPSQIIPRIAEVRLSNASENLRKVSIEQCSPVAFGTYGCLLKNLRIESGVY